MLSITGALCRTWRADDRGMRVFSRKTAHFMRKSVIGKPHNHGKLWANQEFGFAGSSRMENCQYEPASSRYVPMSTDEILTGKCKNWQTKRIITRYICSINAFMRLMRPNFNSQILWNSTSYMKFLQPLPSDLVIDKRLFVPQMFVCGREESIAYTGRLVVCLEKAESKDLPSI